MLQFSNSEIERENAFLLSDALIPFQLIKFQHFVHRLIAALATTRIAHSATYQSKEEKRINIFVIDASEKIQSTFSMTCCRNSHYTVHTVRCGNLDSSKSGHKFEIFNIASLKDKGREQTKKRQANM